ncbi:putative coiled coil [Cryptosporidium sp. chipmunk genotype I]|uniref:putative coiled coil n=1 Tax=Cryptosporidium sp. chipmunk genotype I TaxID=1280935 RepID=UPI003519EB26|nr:putative coiled coil [Cryptosporidium sp. chipmunk genotype I]
MQFNYDDPNNKKIDGFVEFESELAKLREETSLLYKNEYVKDFLENYHLEVNETKENRKGRWSNKREHFQTRNSKLTKSKLIGGTHQPYSYDVECKSEYEVNEYTGSENGDANGRKNAKVKSFKEKNQEKIGRIKGKRRDLVDVGINDNGFAVFSRKYGSEDLKSGKKYLTVDLSEIKGDIIKSPKKNTTSLITGASKKNNKKVNSGSIRQNSKKNCSQDVRKQTILYQNKKLSKPNSKFKSISPSYSLSSSSSSSSSLEGSENEYRNQINKYKKNHYTKGDEKIKYYLDQSSLDDDNEGGDEDEGNQELEDQKNGLAVSNSFLSRLPSSNQAQLMMASQQYEQNERDLLLKRIQSLEVIESSQKMLILETQNKEQQYRIRSEELQKQVEYKDTKLLLLNQDYEILKRDFGLLKDEKEMLKNKFTEMETHWNEEYGNLYKYKIDYEILSKQNETLMIEKNSFINLIEQDKERYRKMELNNTSLMLNVDNLEKRNHEVVERCSKLQEDNDSLSREYNKLYQKYTALLSEYTVSKKNEENLNAALVELQDTNKKLDIEGRDMKEKYKTLSATERVLEQLQESNAGLIGEVSALKEERDILSADYKILEKKYKTSEESVHEMKNQLLDFTLENQKLKKLIKQTIIPLIPDAEYNSTIGHILMVLNAKENSRMSIKVLEEEYLNNISNSGKGKNKDELQLEVSKAWKGIESPFSPKKMSYMMNRLSIDHHQSNTISRLSLSPKSVGNTTNLEKKSSSLSPLHSSSPKSLNNKFKNTNKNAQSPKSFKYNSNLNKFEKLSPKGHQPDKDELKTNSMPILEKGNINEKVVIPKLFNSCPDLNRDKDENTKILIQEEKNQEIFKKGVQIVTPRPFVIDEDDHSVPAILPKRLEGKIKNVLENEDKIIPVIPESISSMNEKEPYEDDIILKKDNIEDGPEFLSEKEKKKDHGEPVDANDKNSPSINDTIRMIDNYEKQILLLNVEKVQLEAELAALPKDNWLKNTKEKENRDNIERRILEIQNSIIKASSNIKHLKEKQHKSNINSNHKDHSHHHHQQQQQKQQHHHHHHTHN